MVEPKKLFIKEARQYNRSIKKKKLILYKEME